MIGRFEISLTLVGGLTVLGHSGLSSLSHCGVILALRPELVCTRKFPLEKSAGGD